MIFDNVERAGFRKMRKTRTNARLGRTYISTRCDIDVHVDRYESELLIWIPIAIAILILDANANAIWRRMENGDGG